MSYSLALCSPLTTMHLHRLYKDQRLHLNKLNQIQTLDRQTADMYHQTVLLTQPDTPLFHQNKLKTLYMCYLSYMTGLKMCSSAKNSLMLTMSLRS